MFGRNAKVTLAVILAFSCLVLLALFLRTDIFESCPIFKDVVKLSAVKTSERQKGDHLCPPPGVGRFTLKNIRCTALVSFPGSGNTWTRYLLTTASGILTATAYNYPGEVGIYMKSNEKRVIAVKTHEKPGVPPNRFQVDRCILLIRNPYEAFLANFNRIGKRNKSGYSLHHTIRPAEDFVTVPKYVSQRIRGWSSLYTAWLSKYKPPSVHVLVYSRMKENLGHELDLVFRFLNESTITPRIHCALQYSEGWHHRGGHEWQKNIAVFSMQQKQILNKAIDEMQISLEKVTGKSFKDILAWKR